MKLQELDLGASYGPNSPGINEQCLIGQRGKMYFGTDLWKIGRKALDTLESIIKNPSEYKGPQQWANELPILAKDFESLLDDALFPVLCEAHDEGLMVCEGIKSAWPEYDYPAKMELAARALEPLRLALPGNSLDDLGLPAMIALAILIRLDDALIAEFCFGNGLDGVLLDIASLKRHLDTMPSNEAAMRYAMLAMAKREFGIAGAAGRHAENRAIKQDVFAWLDEHFPAQKSMDAAAQTIAGKVAPVAFRTARDWVGEWKKLRSTGTP